MRNCIRNNCHIYSLIWAAVGPDIDPVPTIVCNISYDILDRDVSTPLLGVGSAVIGSTFMVGADVVTSGIGAFSIGTSFVVGPIAGIGLYAIGTSFTVG